METFNGCYSSTKTTEFFININKFVYLFGLPNFWIEELDFSDMFKKVFDKFNKFGNMAVLALLFSEYGAIFTQKNLSESQTSDLILFIISHTIIIGFLVRMTQQEQEIRELMYTLGIHLKQVYNDAEVEEQMIKRSKFFCTALVFNTTITVSMMTMQAVMMAVRYGITFNTVILTWPDVEDRSLIGNIVRTIFNLFWWIFLTRVFAVYNLVICLTIAVSHQFKNLNSYFYNLSRIFDDGHLTHDQKENKYETGLKVGIKLHAETLKCTSQIQVICGDVFSGQIIFALLLLALLMFQMASSVRNLANVMTIVFTAFTILCSTGCFMWNAGDISVEAEKLPTAMFCSGWENCYRQSSVRVKKLICIAMMQAQQPVVLTGLGIIPLSYQSYVSIVKSSYSVFSVVY